MAASLTDIVVQLWARKSLARFENTWSRRVLPSCAAVDLSKYSGMLQQNTNKSGRKSGMSGQQNVNLWADRTKWIALSTQNRVGKHFKHARQSVHLPGMERRSETYKMKRIAFVNQTFFPSFIHFVTCEKDICLSITRRTLANAILIS